MKSLKAQGNPLASAPAQLEILDRPGNGHCFAEHLEEIGLYPLKPTGIDTLQVNLGKMCNQTCSHCHVDAGPDRREIMTREVMEHCLRALDWGIRTVDLTGGAPEMNPDFRWFVEQLAAKNREIIIRSNLTILTVNDHYRELPDFFARHRATVISSLPCYTAENTDRQRGDGVFQRSIEGLRALNAVGYGREGTGLELHLVYNPGGPSLPPPQEKLESDYKRILSQQFGVSFNQLFCLTNMPISRFLDFLLNGGRYEEYMEKLINAFNPTAARRVMCRNLLSVGWDGRLYDCDFNQMLELPVAGNGTRHIRDFDWGALMERNIVVNQHCYGCTAGAGSSCGGETV